jgi:hypothetical protein
LEQRAHQRIGPQSDFAGFGFEHRIIAAVDERDRARSGREKRFLDGIRVETT